MITGSIEINHEAMFRETRKRIDVLYKNHNSWLHACAYNLSKNQEVSQDLVQELYLYLLEKQNPKLHYQESFNLLYCHRFLTSRFNNFIKRQNKSVSQDNMKDTPLDVYDVDKDMLLEQAYDDVKGELQKLTKTKLWPSAKLYELYAFSTKTMDEISKEIGICKSTTFLHIKKTKEYLKKNVENPFKDEHDED
tara:strand:- start:15 stop:593 length:579 start_codon:yes stop_codon:yes gene_type:complete